MHYKLQIMVHVLRLPLLIPLQLYLVELKVRVYLISLMHGSSSLISFSLFQELQSYKLGRRSILHQLYQMHRELLVLQVILEFLSLGSLMEGLSNLSK